MSRRGGVRAGDDAGAAGAIDKLISDYGGDDETVKAAGGVAGRYFSDKKYDKALGLYERIVETWPDAGDSVWGQAGVVRSYIALGDDTHRLCL